MIEGPLFQFLLLPAASKDSSSLCCLAAGSGNAEKTGLAFRLGSDLTLVSMGKKLQPVCELLRQLATNHGIGDITFEDHVCKGKVLVEAGESFDVSLFQH